MIEQSFSAPKEQHSAFCSNNNGKFSLQKHQGEPQKQDIIIMQRKNNVKPAFCAIEYVEALKHQDDEALTLLVNDDDPAIMTSNLALSSTLEENLFRFTSNDNSSSSSSGNLGYHQGAGANTMTHVGHGKLEIEQINNFDSNILVHDEDYHAWDNDQYSQQHARYTLNNSQPFQEDKKFEKCKASSPCLFFDHLNYDYITMEWLEYLLKYHQSDEIQKLFYSQPLDNDSIFVSASLSLCNRTNINTMLHSFLAHCQGQEYNQGWGLLYVTCPHALACINWDVLSIQERPTTTTTTTTTTTITTSIPRVDSINGKVVILFCRRAWEIGELLIKKLAIPHVICCRVNNEYGDYNCHRSDRKGIGNADAVSCSCPCREDIAAQEFLQVLHDHLRKVILTNRAVLSSSTIKSAFNVAANAAVHKEYRITGKILSTSKFILLPHPQAF